MAGESTFADAADRLLVLFARACPDTLVTDGKGLTDTAEGEVLSVGYSDNDDENYAEGSAQWEGAGGIQDRETYDIHCGVIVVDDTGAEGDLSAARARARDLLAAIRRQLIIDATLGGVVLNASVTGWSYRGTKITGGARALLRFDVTCDAYTTA